MGTSQISAGQAYVAIYGDNKPLIASMKKLAPEIRKQGEELGRIGEVAAASFNKGAERIIHLSQGTKAAAEELEKAGAASAAFQELSTAALLATAQSSESAAASTGKLVTELSKASPATKGFASAFQAIKNADVSLVGGSFGIKTLIQLLRAAGPAVSPLSSSLRGLTEQQQKLNEGWSRGYGLFSVMVSAFKAPFSIAGAGANSLLGVQGRTGRNSAGQQVARQSQFMATLFGTKEQKLIAKQMGQEADAAAVGAAYAKGWFSGFSQQVKLASGNAVSSLFRTFVFSPVTLTRGLAGIAFGSRQAKTEMGAMGQQSISLMGRLNSLGNTMQRVRKMAAGEGMMSVSRGLGVGALAAGAIGAISGISALAGNRTGEVSGRTQSIGLSAAKQQRSVESTSEVEFAAAATGTKLKTVDDGMDHFASTIKKAAAGEAEEVAALTKLGLAAESLQNLTLDQKMQRLGKALENIKDPIERDKRAIDVLGSSGAELTSMLTNIDGLRQKAKNSGAVISSADVEAAKRMSNAMNELKAVMSNAWNQIGASSIQSTTRWVTGAANFIQSNRLLLQGLLKIVAGLGAAAGGLVLFQTFGGPALMVIKSLGMGVAAMLSPVGLVMAAIGGGAAAWMYFTESGRKSASYLGNTFSELGAFFGQVWGGIVAAIGKGDIATAGEIAFTMLKIGLVKALDTMGLDWKSTMEVFYKSAQVAQDMVTNGWALVMTGFRSMQNGIAKGTLVLTEGLAKIWAQYFAGLRKGMNNTHNLLGKGMLYAYGKLTGRSDEDMKSDFEGMDQQTNFHNSTAEQERLKAQSEPLFNNDLIKRLNSLDQSTVSDNATTENKRQTAVDSHKETFDSRVSALGDQTNSEKLAALQAQLNDAIGRAKSIDTDKSKKLSKFTPDEMTLGTKEGSVAGTFSAVAAGQLGGGAIQQVAKSTAETVKELKKINDDLKNWKPESKQFGQAFPKTDWKPQSGAFGSVRAS